jgi:hypothetical protein
MEEHNLENPRKLGQWGSNLQTDQLDMLATDSHKNLYFASLWR